MAEERVVYGTSCSDGPLPDHYEAQLAASDLECEKRDTRIEALRAASRIVAGPNFQTTIPLVAATFEIAEQFARWLETGKR